MLLGHNVAYKTCKLYTKNYTLKMNMGKMNKMTSDTIYKI